MFSWNEKPTKAEVRHRIGGENPARVVEIGWGQYKVTIPDDPEAEITYVRERGHQKPTDAFPNMEVVDGAMRIPLDDVVDAILSRVDPVEIATALWANDEVREQFVYALSERYSEMNVGDKDRRKFLAEVNGAVYSKALDEAVNKLGNLESRYGSKWFFWNQIIRARDIVRNIYPDAESEVRLADPDSDADFRCTGSNWTEAREHWRKELLAMFPAPEAAPADEAEVL